MKAARKTSSTKSSRSNTPDKPVGSSSGSRVASSSSSAANNESIRKMARRGFAETLKSIFMLVKEFREKTTGEAATGGGSSPKKLPKKHQWMESLQVSSAINLEDSRFLALEIEEEMYQQCAVYGECGSRVKDWRRRCVV